MGRFVERHRRQLIETLKIPQARVPSYSTIRRVMMSLDYEALTQVFNDWASQYTNNNCGQSLGRHGRRRRFAVLSAAFKDVITKEDTSPTLLGKASTNISLIKSWVLNLLRVHGFDSLTEALDYMSNNLPLLLCFCH